MQNQYIYIWKPISLFCVGLAVTKAMIFLAIKANVLEHISGLCSLPL